MVNSSIISSWDFLRVSGIQKTPNIAFNKHIIPKVIMQAASPNVSNMKGNVYPRANKTMHVIETTIARDISRIYRRKNCKYKLNRMKDTNVVNSTYILWKYFNANDIRDWNKANATEVNDAGETKRRNPFIFGLFEQQ